MSLLSRKGFFLRIIKRNTSNIGFIGIGNMGSRMAKNLAKNGESLIIYDTNSQSLKPFENHTTVRIASSVKEVAQNSSCIITMLLNNETVWSTFVDDDGILKNFRKNNGVFIDCSTVDPSIPQKISKLCEEKKHSFVDAPVSGGIIGAENGTITFMIGGDEQISQTIQPLLLKMGKSVIYCGPSGMGQTAKLCNNMLLGISMAAVAEAMNLGIKFGLNPKLLTSIINSSSGRCWSSDVYNPVPGIIENTPSCNNYEGGFKTNLLLKDIKLVLNLAKQTNMPTPLAIKAHEIYDKAAKSGYGEKDFSAVYKYFSEHS